MPCRLQTVEESVLQRALEISCKFGARCKNPSCNCGHPPMCHNYETETGCTYGNRCFFRQSDAEEAPSNKSKKESAKGSVASLKESPNWLCISGFLSEEVSSTESWKIGIERISGTQCEILGNPGAPRFEDRSHEENLKTRRLCPQSSVGLGEKCSQALKQR